MNRHQRLLFLSPVALALFALLIAGDAAAADAFQTLASFSAASGNTPASGIVRDRAGNLYGSAQNGGAHGSGSVYRLSADGGGLTSLHDFAGTDGKTPVGKLILDPSGNLYGTTSEGGTSGLQAGSGTVFKIAANGAFSTLHVFTGTDGASPLHGVSLDSLGNLYGTTRSGADNENGSVFKIAANGTFSTLYAFQGPEGRLPSSGILIDNSGNLHGVTEFGGGGQENNAGTLFQLAAGSYAHSVLHVFSYDNDSENPSGDLTFDSSGNIWGTTGDEFPGRAFRRAPSGLVTFPHEFLAILTSIVVIANYNSGSLTPDALGNVYGTSTLTYIDETQGSNGQIQLGTIFKISATGAFTTLHVFDEHDGIPNDGLTFDSQGNLYGTTSTGGTNGVGTIFKLSGVTP